MKGLELARSFFTEHGEPMLREQFPELEGLVAAGLVGSGSECFGYDDEVSTDHDFEPGFCIFIPDEERLDRRAAFRLERAYAKLPKEHMGFKRSAVSPVGGNRHGVIRTADFYRARTGLDGAPETARQWFSIPDYALAEATNGEVFYDGLGEFSAIRAVLLDMPEDVRRKKLAGRLLLMAQSGQYNFIRCLKHDEPAAAQLAAYEFTVNAMHALFLLNRRYMPFYKWSFRALRGLPGGEALAFELKFIITSGRGEEQEQYETIESVAADVISRLQAQGLTTADCGDLEKHAYSVNDGIEDASIRNENIMIAV